MQICIFVTQGLVIVWCKENGIFTLKNEILKHVDFASEWRESRFRGLEFFKIFRGRMPPDLLQGDRRMQPSFIKPPLLKTCIRPTALASYTGAIIQLSLSRTPV